MRSLALGARGINLAAALLAAICLVATAGRGAERLPPSSEQGLLQFANMLRGEQDHYRAITEYRRLLFHYPQTQHAEAARRAIAGCYIAAERWDDAEAWLTELEGRAAGAELRRWATLTRAGVRFRAGRFEAAASAYDEFLADHPEAPAVHEARWRKAWCLLFAHRFKLAEAAFRAIGPPSPFAEAAGQLADAAHRLARRRHRSPLLAGILGIVPGLGHVYCGRYKDGLVAFVVNGLLGWGAGSGFAEGAEAAGTVLGLFGTNFYMGSIFGAVNWAHRVNRERAQKAVDKLRGKHGI